MMVYVLLVTIGCTPLLTVQYAVLGVTRYKVTEATHDPAYLHTQRAGVTRYKVK